MPSSRPDIVELPDDRRELGEMLRNSVRYGERMRNIEAITWGVVRYWLQGVRDFSILNHETGTVDFNWSIPGEMLVYEQALSEVQQEIGRLSKLSLRPVVNPLGVADLDGVRKAAMGHAFLSYHSPRMGYEAAKRAHDTYLVHYGTVGLTATEGPVPRGREEEWRPRYEVVPPWELIPIPGDVPSPMHARAIVRQRWVPLSWLEAYAATSKKGGIKPKVTLPANKSKMFVRGVPFGGAFWDRATGSMGPLSALGTTISSGGSSALDPVSAISPKPQEHGYETFIEFNEILFSNDRIHLDRYIMLAGTEVIGDRNYWDEGIEVWHPLGVSRYTEVGSWYGHSFAASKIEINRITERMIASLVRNVEDIDSFGAILVPRNQGVKTHDFKKRRDGGPRIVSYQPDPLSPDIKPFNIAPNTSGTFPRQAFEAVMSAGARIFPLTSLASPESPYKRADSPSSLTMIDNAANESRTPVSDYMVEAWNTVHRYVLDSGRRRYTDAKGVLPLATLDLAVVGVVYDPTKGGIQLDRSVMPIPDEVKITVESMTPRDKQVVAQHLWQSLQMQIITPRQFRIQWHLTGLSSDLPVDNEAEWASYQQAQLNVILAFNDGKTPGQVIDTMTGVADVHRSVYSAFMASPRYSVASPPVRAQLKKLLDAYTTGIGMPDAAPHAEDAAAQMGASPQRQSIASLMSSIPGGAQ